MRILLLGWMVFMQGCLLDPYGPRRGPAFLAEPEPSKIVVMYDRDNPGDAEVKDAVIRVIGLVSETRASMTLEAYEVGFLDMDGKPLSSLDIARQPLSALVTVSTGVSTPDLHTVKLPLMRPAVVEFGRPLLGATSSYTISAEVTLFGRDNTGELRTVVPIQFTKGDLKVDLRRVPGLDDSHVGVLRSEAHRHQGADEDGCLEGAAH